MSKFLDDERHNDWIDSLKYSTSSTSSMSTPCSEYFYRRISVEPPKFEKFSEDAEIKPLDYKEELVLKPEFKFKFDEPFEKVEAYEYFKKVHSDIVQARGRLEEIKQHIEQDDEPATKDEEFTFDPEDLDI